VLACFTAAHLAFVARRNFLAGLALGLLAFQPEFWDWLLATPQHSTRPALSRLLYLAFLLPLFGAVAYICNFRS
jgi:hypothetical protein